MMQKHLQSDKWLDTTKYPDITFDVVSLENVKTSDNKTTADITGMFALHGVTNKITVPVKINYLKDRLKERLPQLQGDLLVLRATFTIKRGEYGINKGAFEDKVSDDVELALSLAGQSPR
jgi:polyisoprenoid-binding protein YceI